MTNPVPRREVLAALPMLAAAWPLRPAAAQGRPTLTAVEWGGQTLASMRSVQQFQSVADVRWELHAGGAAAILAKIAASWPRVNYDVVAAWNPVFVSMVREGWLETLTQADTPNMADIPDALFVKDGAGAIKAVPRELNPHMWGYRPDLMPFQIARLEELLDKRLRGRVLFPAPVLNTGTQMITVARAFGGSESAMEPAWAFVKKLAESGNIGRASNSDTETANSLSSGETCIGFSAASGFLKLEAAGVAMTPLAKMPAESGFRTALAMQGWCVLKGGQTALAKSWINALIAPEPDAMYAAGTGSVPVNVRSAISPRTAPIRYSAEELAAHTYSPDWNVVSQELPGWVQRWEREIAPLL